MCFPANDCMRGKCTVCNRRISEVESVLYFFNGVLNHLEAFHASVSRGLTAEHASLEKLG